MSDALPLVDAAKLYDNSLHDTPFKGVATLIRGDQDIHVDPLPQWAKGLLGTFISE